MSLAHEYFSKLPANLTLDPTQSAGSKISSFKSVHGEDEALNSSYLNSVCLFKLKSMKLKTQYLLSAPHMYLKLI